MCIKSVFLKGDDHVEAFPTQGVGGDKCYQGVCHTAIICRIYPKLVITKGKVKMNYNSAYQKPLLFERANRDDSSMSNMRLRPNASFEFEFPWVKFSEEDVIF